MRRTRQLQRTHWLLSKRKPMWRRGKRRTGHDRNCVPPAANGNRVRSTASPNHRIPEPSYSARRLLRYNYNGRTRTPKGCQWGLWYCSPCCRRNVPEVRWCSAQHNCGSTACSDRSPIPMRKAPCYTTSRYTYVVRTWINIQLAIMGSISSLRILFVVLGHIDHLWYGNSVEMTESLSGSQL